MEKHKIKRILSLAVAASMCLAFAGCSSGGGQTGGGEKSGGSAEDGNFNSTGYPIVKQPVTLKVMWSIRDTDSYVPFESMDCNKNLEKLTNIHIEPELIKSSDWNTKLNLMFTSGEYPDIIMATEGNVDAEEYGVSQNILLPVDDLADKYMPTYKKRAKDEPQVMVGMKASDGKTYAIGRMTAQNINIYSHYFINKTWLDKLGLQMPKTLDDLTNVLRAFKTKDPNGNGKADEVPYETFFSPGAYEAVTQILPFFGVPVDNFFIDDNKKVQFAPYQAGYRAAMEWLHTLYSERLIDPEAISQDSNMVWTKLAEGNVGVFTAWRLQAMPFSDWAVKNATLMDPVSAKGYKTSLPTALEVASPGAYVTTSNKHLPETMRWLDAVLDTETMYTMKYGKEGIGWNKNDKGLIETNDTETQKMPFSAMNDPALFFAPPKYITSVYKWAPQRLEKTTYCKHYTEAGYTQKYSDSLLGIAPHTADEKSRLQLLSTDINNSIKEHLAAFAKNGVTDQSWDEFVEAFKGMNVDEYISIEQKALNKLDMSQLNMK